MLEGFFWLFCLTWNLHWSRSMNVSDISAESGQWLLVSCCPWRFISSELPLHEGMAESITKLSRVTDNKSQIECEQDFYKPLLISVNEAPLSIWNNVHKQYQSREGLSMLKSLEITSEEPGFLELVADWKGQVKWLLQTRLLTFLN